MRGCAAVGNLVLLTPAYTALQTRISIVLQSVTAFITSPLRTHRGVIPQKIAKLNSCFCEQQQGPLKGLGRLLASLAGTVVHRGWPVGQISCPRRDCYTTAPYVFCTYHVCVCLSATFRALELCLRGSVAGVDVSAGWAGLAGVLGWYSHELPSIPSGLVLELLADGTPALRQD